MYITVGLYRTIRYFPIIFPRVIHTRLIRHVPGIQTQAMAAIASQNASIALPKRPMVPLGHLYHDGGAAPVLVLEAFVDYCCPYSARLFKRLTEEVSPAFPQMRLIFQQVPQPWHSQSVLLHESVAAVRHCYGIAKTNEFQALLFANQKMFFDSNSMDMSRNQITGELAKLAATLEGVDEKAILARMTVDTSDPNVLNAGTPSTRVIKFYVKAHRKLGIHVTPTTRINGLEADTSSGWTLDQWSEFLEPYMACAGQGYKRN